MAIFVTLYRVSHRKQTRGLWWDDHFAVLALVLDIVAFVFTWVDSPMGKLNNILYLQRSLIFIRPHTKCDIKDSDCLASEFNLHSHHVVSINYFSPLRPHNLCRPARISLTLSISRILTPSEPFFKYTILSAFLFGLFMAAGVIMVTVVCGQNTSWYYAPPFQCIIPRSLGFYFISSRSFESVCGTSILNEFLGHVVADTILIALPLRIFWHVRLPLIEKNVILVGFAASAITTTASIVFTVVLMSNNMSRAEKARLAPVLIELLVS